MKTLASHCVGESVSNGIHTVSFCFRRAALAVCAAMVAAPLWVRAEPVAAQSGPLAERLLRSSSPGAVPLPEGIRSYRPSSYEAPSDWRGANATVKEIGGWRTYAGQVQTPPNTPGSHPMGDPSAPAAISSPRPASPGTSHHGGHR